MELVRRAQCVHAALFRSGGSVGETRTQTPRVMTLTPIYVVVFGTEAVPEPSSTLKEEETNYVYQFQ
jgi:hypothetical protein